MELKELLTIGSIFGGERMEKDCGFNTKNKVIVWDAATKAALTGCVGGNCSIYFGVQFITVTSSLCPSLTSLSSGLGAAPGAAAEPGGRCWLQGHQAAAVGTGPRGLAGLWPLPAL